MHHYWGCKVLPGMYFNTRLEVQRAVSCKVMAWTHGQCHPAWHLMRWPSKLSFPTSAEHID